MKRSHAIALLGTILLLGAGAALIYAWSARTVRTVNPEPVQIPEGVVCSQEARLCPDGTYVGRTGPLCEFAPCAGETSGSGHGVIDESIGIAGLRITALEVLEDSRCPQGVQCIQAGTVRVRTQVASATSVSVVELELNTPQRVLGKTVTLMTVEPAVYQNRYIPQNQYLFTFLVSAF